MKTLILNGSPRPAGDCVTLITEFKKHLNGEVKIVSSYRDHIAFCNDCRFCKTHAGCAIQDGMQEVYACVEQYDNLVLASPIYFSELTGSLLGLMSRLQTYFCQRRFRQKPVPMTRKNGVLILTGAEKDTDAKPQETARTLFKMMNTQQVAYVFSDNTDNIPACLDEKALQQARDAAVLINKLFKPHEEGNSK